MKAIALLVPMVLIVLLIVWVTRLARRLGYKLGDDVIVRCRSGHLFTTVWIPGVKFKALDFGLVRFQHCPVGEHWTFVVPVRDSDLTDEERRFAEQHHDVPVP